jgi:hypothetical protein
VFAIAGALFGISLLYHVTPIEMLHWHNIFQRWVLPPAKYRLIT